MIPPVLEASCFSGSLHICRCFASAWHGFLVNLAWYMRRFLPVFCKVNKDNINQMPQPLKKKKQHLFSHCAKSVCWVANTQVAFLAPSQSDSEVGSGCSPAFASLGSSWRELADKKLGLMLPGVALLQKNAREVQMFLVPGVAGVAKPRGCVGRRLWPVPTLGAPQSSCLACWDVPGSTGGSWSQAAGCDVLWGWLKTPSSTVPAACGSNCLFYNYFWELKEQCWLTEVRKSQHSHC